MRYLIFVAGALEVPPCFNPNDDFLEACAALGYQTLLLGEDKMQAVPDEVLIAGLTVDAEVREVMAAIAAED